jgi:hypothetical protein
MRLFINISVIFALLMLSSCSTNEDDPIGPANQNTVTLKVTVTATESYYIDIAQEQLAVIDDYLMDDAWDIVIDNLTRVRLNGGSTASGNVFATLVENVDYDDITVAPDRLYKADTQDELAIGESWYFYDISTHTVNPLDVVYVIRGGDGSFYKFQITEVNFPSRTDGELSLRFDKISDPVAAEFPDGLDRVQFYRLPLSGTSNTFFNFKDATTVDVTDEHSSIEWDLKSEFVTVSLNGGASGPGEAGAVTYSELAFDSIYTSPADGFISDNGDDVMAIGDSWYIYDFVTHTLSIDPKVYIIKTANGNFAKLEFVKTDFSGQNDGVALIRFHYIEGTSEF